jgi:hypothetical protein
MDTAAVFSFSRSGLLATRSGGSKAPALRCPDPKLGECSILESRWGQAWTQARKKCSEEQQFSRSIKPLSVVTIPGAAGNPLRRRLFFQSSFLAQTMRKRRMSSMKKTKPMKRSYLSTATVVTLSRWL